MAGFDINIDKTIELTVKLGKLHRSALPVAIRGTLNDAAFETKKKIPKMASRKFITRNKAFFKAFSGVNKAQGFNINQMRAEVGILPNKGGKGSKIAQGLEKQETGGTLTGRKLIAHDMGRVSGSHQKRLRKKHRFQKIRIAQAGKKGKTGANHLLIKKGGKGTVFEIKKSGKKQRLTPVYTYRNTKKTRLRPRPFMKPASFLAQRKMGEFYKKQAERQFKRLLR